MKTTLKDVVFGTPAGMKAMEYALKKSCEDQVKLLEEVKNEFINNGRIK
jgi:succinate dehydrogenase/fumarate reductase flavoprotein subunit